MSQILNAVLSNHCNLNPRLNPKSRNTKSFQTPALAMAAKYTLPLLPYGYDVSYFSPIANEMLIFVRH